MICTFKVLNRSDLSKNYKIQKPDLDPYVVVKPEQFIL